jgi:hypothetical protein
VVKVPLTQNQFDALVSLVYNIGQTAFSNSTLLKKLNAKDYQGAADQFLRWNKGGGKVMKGLVRRREAERALFLEVTYMCKRSFIASIVTLLCLLLSSCTAHSIKTNVNISVCLQCVQH